MKTFKQIIALFPSPIWLAEHIRAKAVSDITVRQWGNRNSIPSKYWGDFVRLAMENDIENVSFAVMAKIAANAKKPEAA